MLFPFIKSAHLNTNGMNLDCGTLNSYQVARLVCREHPDIMKTIHIKNRNQLLPAPLRVIYCYSYLARLRGLKSPKIGEQVGVEHA